MRRIMASAVVGLALAMGGAGPAIAAEGVEIPSQSWSFDGPFGTFDRAEAQRGLQVYQENCSSCHSLRLVSYRNLTALGYSDAQIQAIASEKDVTDGPDDEGEMFERPARPSDRFVSPFPNDNAAIAANGGAMPPDLSLITKSRIGGPDYLYALLTGYEEEPPADFDLPDGAYYNEYFPGHQIAMPPPLFDDLVEYADGTPATVDQMARDVTTFLSWAASPEMEERKTTGIKVILFLLILTGLLYAYKRKIWADLH
ncbi:MAG: cytochrome c1 [Alphaproteobacteria bacterium]|nr:cytochrome c1 [Alphaproteobacteria bacterium]